MATIRFFVLAYAVVLARPMFAAVFTVTNNFNSGPGSLRQAILDVNAAAPGAHQIHFNLAGPLTITPSSELPAITQPGTIVDGTTQPGYVGKPIVQLDGVSAGATPIGLQVLAANVTIRGVNVIRFFNGVQAGAANFTLAGSWIGVGADGVTDRGNRNIGVACLSSCGGMTIGGAAASDRNVVSGNDLVGLRIGSGTVRGNFIGVGADGTTSVPNAEGIWLTGSSTIESNTIAMNSGIGIRMDGGHSTFRLNSIYGNGALGIDLGGNGVTPNDPTDSDSGPNDLQNFPALTSAAGNAGNITVTGQTNSNNALVTVDIYHSASCDPSSFGEGATWIGSVDSDGAFSVVVAAPASGVLTATATNAGSTSEFSQCRTITATPPPPATLSFSASSYTVAENAGSRTITVNRNGDTDGAVSVNYATQAGTAGSSDFTAVSGTLTWAHGDGAPKTFPVPILNDSTFETDEDFLVKLSNASGASLGTSTATVTITDDDPPPSAGLLAWAESSYSVLETAGSVTVAVERVGGSAGAASVQYQTFSGTAAIGDDFAGTSGTLTWAAGDAAPKSIVVPIVDDSLDEQDEFFAVRLSNATGATLTANISTLVTIVDVFSRGTIVYSPTTLSVSEGAGTVTLTLIRTGGLNGTVNAAYFTEAVTADGTDFGETAGVFQWGDRDVSPRSFTVTIVGDALDEPDETFIARLQANGGGAASIATVTILDDDPPPDPGTLVFSQPEYSASEGEGIVTITINRMGGSAGPRSVTYAVTGGTATAGDDFQAVSGALNWADGETGSKSFTIPILDDALDEPVETFTVTVGGDATASAPVSIADDDAALAIPAASEWSLILLAAVLAIAGAMAMRR